MVRCHFMLLENVILGVNCIYKVGGDVETYGCTTLSIASHASRTGYGSTSRGNINDLLALPSQW